MRAIIRIWCLDTREKLILRQFFFQEKVFSSGVYGSECFRAVCCCLCVSRNFLMFLFTQVRCPIYITYTMAHLIWIASCGTCKTKGRWQKTRENCCVPCYWQARVSTHSLYMYGFSSPAFMSSWIDLYDEMSHFREDRRPYPCVHPVSLIITLGSYRVSLAYPPKSIYIILQNVWFPNIM